MKEELLLDLLSLLKKSGFKITDCSRIHSCFDVFAKRKQAVLLVKVLANIEALDERTSQELKKVSTLVSGKPLVIGDHMKNKKLEKGVIYSRHDIHVLNLETLEGILKGEEFPKVYSIRGNYCVKINPQSLAKLRNNSDLTQKELAQKLKVSKQSIYRYESEGKISLQVAERIEKLFGEEILMHKKLLKELFSPSPGFKLPKAVKEHLTRLQRIAISDLEELGFRTSPTHAPFNLVAIDSKEEKVFTVVSNDSRGLERKAELIRKISDLLHYHKVCVSEKGHDLGIIVVTPKELEKLSQAQELIDLISEE